MYYVTSGGYQVGHDHDIPKELLGRYRDNARVFREYEPSVLAPTTRCLVTVAYFSEWWPNWPALVLALPYGPSHPGGVLVVPETAICFIGSLDILVAYRLDTLEEVWQDVADNGCFGWNRAGDYVLMSAELELAAWDIDGEKRWSTLVEPPWSYQVEDGLVYLNMMDNLFSFPLDTGPTE
jgi:hypothetical protein